MVFARAAGTLRPMPSSLRASSACAFLCLLVLAPPAAAAPPALFPSDDLTVADPAQQTGRRVDLPLPDCKSAPSDCHEIRLVNQLDGFDLDPRVAIRFDRAIDVAKVNTDTVFLQRADGRGPRIGLNRLVWSPARTALFGQPRQLLAEGTRYRLTVTRALSGRGATTTFTTMTATPVLQRLREQLDDGSAYDAAGIGAGDRGLRFVRPDGRRLVFSAAGTPSIERLNDRGRTTTTENVLNTAGRNAGTYAFGSFLAPRWLDGNRVIPQAPTRTGRSRPLGVEEVGFALILPRGAKPAGGWPVAIFGPGVTRSKYDVFLAADEALSRGIAVIAIDPVGHSFGPRSETIVRTASGVVRFPAFGRGRDLDGDGAIGDREGLQAPGAPHPVSIVALRDGLRQTALDNMALVRAIARGADVDGDGGADLQTTGMSYFAQSLGGIYGTMVMAVDPLLGVGGLNVPGGPILEIARLAPGFRPSVAVELRNRRPSLLNGGRNGFTESQPLYAEPPVTAPAQGAIPIQETGARTNWVNRPGSPETFARLAAQKRIMYQFAFGDATVPNPTSATIVRAGGLLDRTTLYRNDRTPTAGSNPHGFLLDPRLAGRQPGQAQIADFLAAGGARIGDPDGSASVFEVPVSDPATLERLNYRLPPASGEPPRETATAAGPGAPAITRLVHLNFTPRRVRVGRLVRLRLRTTRITPEGRAVVLPRATVRVGGRRVRTGKGGTRTIRVRFRRPGLARAIATAAGLRRDRDIILVRRR